MAILKSIKLLIQKHWGYLVEEIVSIGLSVFSILFSINIVKEIVYNFEHGVSFKDTIIKIIVTFSIITVIEIIQYFLALYKEKISRMFQINLSVIFYKKLASIDYDFHENPMFLNDYTRALEEGVENIYQCANNSFAVIKKCIESIAVMSYIFAVDPKIIIVAIGIGIVYMLVALRMGRLNRKKWNEQMPFVRKSWYINRVFTQKDSMADIKISDIDKLLIDNNNKANDEVIKVIEKYQTKASVWGIVGDILLKSIYPLSVGLLAYIMKDSIKDGLADFASLAFAAEKLASLISGLASSIGAVEGVVQDCKVPFDLLKMQGLIEGVEYDDEINDFESIELNDVNFGYTNKKLNLENINVSIKKGERIAIVGANGAGKTTMVKLLLRLYDANSGEIKINGRSYKQTSASKLRKVVGAVFQNVETYALTIAENILLRKPENDEDYKLVDEALKFSGLYDVVHSLPEGVNTDLSREFNHQGMIFSGGQSQRLAIARGYAQNYKLLILDEPSSALDPLAEAKVYENMLEMGKNKTIIFISHRLTSTVHADKIYLFDKGKIIESGNHDELMKLNGVYHHMFISQSAKYLGEDYEW